MPLTELLPSLLSAALVLLAAVCLAASFHGPEEHRPYPRRLGMVFAATATALSAAAHYPETWLAWGAGTLAFVVAITVAMWLIASDLLRKRTKPAQESGVPGGGIETGGPYDRISTGTPTSQGTKPKDAGVSAAALQALRARSAQREIDVRDIVLAARADRGAWASRPLTRDGVPDA